MINSEEFLKFQAEQEQFVAQHVELYMRYLKRDSCSGHIAFDKEKTNSMELQTQLDSIAKEHGGTYIEGIPPSTHSKPVASTHYGTGSVKMHSSCTMTSFLVA